MMKNRQKSTSQRAGANYASSKDYTVARVILDTVPDPLIILNSAFEVLDASRSFYETFKVLPGETEGRTLYELGTKQWDIADLRKLLEEVIPGKANIDSFEVEQDFPTIGIRTMLLNARQIVYAKEQKNELLVTLYDITTERRLEKEKAEAIRQKELMINEMRHRIANSLQLVANTLQIKAVSSTSDEVRTQLEDAYKRLISIGTIHNLLSPVGSDEEVDVARYLISLCRNIVDAMSDSDEKIRIVVRSDPEFSSAVRAMTLGLITSELVMNALKYAFQKKSGTINVTYEGGKQWCLTVSDDGLGMSEKAKRGSGTRLVANLAEQLKAVVAIESKNGTTVKIMPISKAS